MNGTQRIEKALHAKGFEPVRIWHERLQEQVETGWWSGGWFVEAKNADGGWWAAQEPTVREMIVRIDESLGE